MRRIPVWLLWGLPVISGAGFVALWYIVKSAGHVGDWLLPTPLQILSAAFHERARLLEASGATALGAIGGFTAAATLGFGMALLLGLSRSLHAALYPWLLVLQMTPVIVLTPIIVLWAGYGMPSIITITWLISFFPIVANTTLGLLSADLNHVGLFKMCNARRWQELMLLRVPSALPYYLAGLRIAATLAPIGAIFGEYMAGNSSGRSGGLGYLVYFYNAQIRIPELFATALASCLLGFVFVAAVSLLNWSLLHRWHDSFERHDH